MLALALLSLPATARADDAPRKVDRLVTDDAQLMPLSMTVPVFYMPLVVQFVQFCASPETCPEAINNENRERAQELRTSPSRMPR